MPAKENVLLLSENETKLIRKDVDHLVQNIKDNLKLTYEAVSEFEKGSVGPDRGVLGAGTLSEEQKGFTHKTLSPKSDSASGTSLSFSSLPPSSYPTVRKAKSYLSSRSSRASPYFIPGKVQSSGGGGKCTDCSDENGASHANRKWSVAARKRYPSMSANGSKKLEILEDPLEMLHELISEGNLLKEAVRRLNLGLSPKIQRNFYESGDEDCRTPSAIGVGYN